MSDQSEGGEHSFRGGNRTDRTERERLEIDQGTSRGLYATERSGLSMSPTKYDIDFYARKVNRLEQEISNLHDELSLTKFHLTKADDYQHKYELLFKDFQRIATDLEQAILDRDLRSKESDRYKTRLDEAGLTIQTLSDEVRNTKRDADELKKRAADMIYKTEGSGKEQKEAVNAERNRQMELFRQEAKDAENKLKAEISQLMATIAAKDNVEAGLKQKLAKTLDDDQNEINRLNVKIRELQAELSQQSGSSNQKLIGMRNQLNASMDKRIENIQKASSTLEQFLLEEMQGLNEILKKKDTELTFMINCDKEFLKEHEDETKGLKEHINRLQEKIYCIQRENEVELFITIDRLRKQYESNLDALKQDYEQVTETHEELVNSLNLEITNLKKERELLSRENKNIQYQHKKLAGDKEAAVKMLSQKIINLETEKDLELRNYTTSMRNIEDEAKTKLDDLHTAVQSKNAEFEILNAQLKLKNQEIDFLITEISDLRSENRARIAEVQQTNILEQNKLSDHVSVLQREIMEQRNRITQLESEMLDKQAQLTLKMTLLKEELQGQKEANQILKAKNRFLNEWCSELDQDIKKERVQNVNILHDQNISRRETVQAREQVWAEMEAIKNKEVELLNNRAKLDKSRLEAELAKKERDLIEKKEEITRLMIEYKKLEARLGRAAQAERDPEEQGKCKATLEAEILLTENLYHAINTRS